MERQVIEVFVGEELGEQAGPPEATLDEGEVAPRNGARELVVMW